MCALRSDVRGMRTPLHSKNQRTRSNSFWSSSLSCSPQSGQRNSPKARIVRGYGVGGYIFSPFLLGVSVMYFNWIFLTHICIVHRLRKTTKRQNSLVGWEWRWGCIEETLHGRRILLPARLYFLDLFLVVLRALWKVRLRLSFSWRAYSTSVLFFYHHWVYQFFAFPSLSCPLFYISFLLRVAFFCCLYKSWKTSFCSCGRGANSCYTRNLARSSWRCEQNANGARHAGTWRVLVRCN